MIKQNNFSVKELLDVLEGLNELGSGLSEGDIAKAEIVVVNRAKSYEDIDEFVTKFDGADKRVLLRVCADRLTAEDFVRFYEKHKKAIWSDSSTDIDWTYFKDAIERSGAKASTFGLGNKGEMTYYEYVKGAYQIAAQKLKKQKSVNAGLSDKFLMTGLDIILREPVANWVCEGTEPEKVIKKAKAFVTRNKDNFSNEGLEIARSIVQSKADQIVEKSYD